MSENFKYRNENLKSGQELHFLRKFELLVQFGMNEVEGEDDRFVVEVVVNFQSDLLPCRFPAHHFLDDGYRRDVVGSEFHLTLPVQHKHIKYGKTKYDYL